MQFLEEKDEDLPAGLTGIDTYRYGDCTKFAATTLYLLKVAGLPAKTIHGSAYSNTDGYGGHAWNEVYADNRWIYIDLTWGEFDLPISELGKDHSIGSDIKDKDAEAWNGSLYFGDKENENIKFIVYHIR